MLDSKTKMLTPLPERMRPKNLSEYVGQRHLVGPGCILRNMVDSGNLSSFILWGPPGVGKTTLARIIASSLDREFFTLSAVSSGVSSVTAAPSAVSASGLTIRSWQIFSRAVKFMRQAWIRRGYEKK